jgi:hypothetical protein
LIKVAGSDWSPKIKVPINDFPDAVKTKDQEVDETTVLELDQFELASHSLNKILPI